MFLSASVCLFENRYEKNPSQNLNNWVKYYGVEQLYNTLLSKNTALICSPFIDLCIKSECELLKNKHENI